MRVICLSDTHGFHGGVAVPPGDVLVFAGDMCGPGRLSEVSSFARWLRGLPHRHKIVVAGNHDWPFVRDPQTARQLIAFGGGTYLQDAGVVIDGVAFWGSPWQPEFCDWAFNLPRGPQLARRWSLIPPGTNVLVTHGPPLGLLDQSYDGAPHLGCEDLAHRLRDLKDLRAHVFGHIHGGHGVLNGGHTRPKVVNASVCDESYAPVRPCQTIDV